MATAGSGAEDAVERVAGDEQRRVQGAMERMMAVEMAHASDACSPSGSGPASPRGGVGKFMAHDEASRNDSGGEQALDSVHPAAINALRAYLAGSDWRREVRATAGRTASKRTHITLWCADGQVCGAAGQVFRGHGWRRVRARSLRDIRRVPGHGGGHCGEQAALRVWHQSGGL